MELVDVEVDGKLKRLRYSFNDIADIEDKAGMGIFALVSTESRIGMSMLRILYWGGFKHEDRGLTLDRTGLILKSLMENGEDFQSLFVKALRMLKHAGVFPAAIAQEMEENIEREMKTGNPTEPEKSG